MDYTILAGDESINKVVQSFSKNNFEGIVVPNGSDALIKIKELIPQGASLMNGSSVTLDEIGFIDLLKQGNHGWNNLHDAVLAETDKEKQAILRKQSVLSDYYLGSAHAITENGEIIVASNTGSQLPHLAFTSPNIILVVGAHKIVSDLSAGLARIDNYVKELEDKRSMEAYGVGTMHSKTLILHKENPRMGRKIIVIIVKEKLGF